jgi:hypothetical protein
MHVHLCIARALVLACAALSLPTAAVAAETAAPAAPAPAQPDISPQPDAPPPPDASPKQRGWQLGGRVGYALPYGPVSKGSSANPATRLNELETASVPLAIDAGYRLSPAAYLGGTIAWGAGIEPNGGAKCPQGDSCFRQDMQARLEGRLYVDPRARSGWWLGLGVGWEVATFSQGRGGASVTKTYTGPVLADLELGVDARHDLPAIGPYLGITLAEFLSQGLNPATAGSVPTWIPSPDLHVWVTLGVRGALGPW